MDRAVVAQHREVLQHTAWPCQFPPLDGSCRWVPRGSLGCDPSLNVPYSAGRDQWSGKRAAGGMSGDHDRCFSIEREIDVYCHGTQFSNLYTVVAHDTSARGSVVVCLVFVYLMCVCKYMLGHSRVSLSP
jgi:hypothetical protein